MLTTTTWIQWLHILGAVTWVGGIVFVVIILRPVMQKSMPPQERKELLKSVSGRMQRLMNWVIAVQVLTGALLAWPYLRSGGFALLRSWWGQALIWKVALVLVMIVLYVITPRLLVGRSPKLGSKLHYTLIGLGVTIIFLGNFLR